MTSLSEPQLIRRIHDRFGFGPAAGELATAQQSGTDAVLQQRWAQLAKPAVATPPTLDEHLEATGPVGAEDHAADSQATKDKQARATIRKANTDALELWWLDQLVDTPTQLPERLTWFWHGHFATSQQKVKRASLMLEQNSTFRSLGSTTFRALAQAMIVDPALLIWLDGPKNTVEAPNENLGREFMELFSLGHGNYSEDDVKAAARALTGWKVDARSARPSAHLARRQHDDNPKTLLAHTADYDARSFVDLVCDQPAGHLFVTSRIWARLVSSTPPSAAVSERLAAAWGRDGNIPAVLRAIAAEPDFADSASSLVKQPVEWLAGTLRAFGLRPSALPAPAQRQLLTQFRGLGQTPFRPPSVGGWPAGQAWLTTSAALSRTEVARVITSHADLTGLQQTSSANRPEYLRRLLGLDRLSARTSDAIAGVADRPALAAAVAACAPEYVVSA